MGTHLQPLYKSTNETQLVINLRQKLQRADKKFSLTQAGGINDFCLCK